MGLPGEYDGDTCEHCRKREAEYLCDVCGDLLCACCVSPVPDPMYPYEVCPACKKNATEKDDEQP